MIIVIEGGDQAGKKTQTEMLQKALKKRKIKTTTFFVFLIILLPIGKENFQNTWMEKRKISPTNNSLSFICQ